MGDRDRLERLIGIAGMLSTGPKPLNLQIFANFRVGENVPGFRLAIAEDESSQRLQQPVLG
jgi:hypothetical protein